MIRAEDFAVNSAMNSAVNYKGTQYMFGKSSEQSSNGVAKSTAGVNGTGIRSYLGPDLTIVGDLESHGLIQVEGIVQGDVHARQVIVGAKAKVTGNVVADDVTVGGEVDGSVRGLNVTLLAGSRVDGEMHHNSLSIEHGAHFEGHSRRPQDTAELAPKIDKARRA
jgi:cytoskeletal protein CcmA (bactofilin family)